MTHPRDLKMLSDDYLRREINLAKRMVERKTGYKLKWFCYPRGRFDQRVVKAVKSAGYERARTTRIGFDGKPYEREGFHLFQRKEYGDTPWFDYIKERIQEARRRDFNMHIWGHSWEINRDSQWHKFEDILKIVNEGIYTETN